MPLTNAKFGYIEILNKVLSTLQLPANKVILNEDMKRAIQMIDKGDPFTKAVPNSKMPAILVRRAGKHNETIKTFGDGPKRRDASLTVEIWGMVYFTDDSAETDDEMARLANNIEAIFRNDYNLGGTVDLVEPTDVDFDNWKNGQLFVSTCMITLKVTKRVR